MKDPRDRWVMFTLDGQRYALPLNAVSRIVRAAEITALPLAPAIVAGALDVGGRILPVFNLRRRLQLPDLPLALSHQFILAHTSRREVVLMVDAALGMIEAPAQAVDPQATHPQPLLGALSLPDGLVLIQDLEQFLSPSEDEALEQAMREAEVRIGR